MDEEKFYDRGYYFLAFMYFLLIFGGIIGIIFETNYKFMLITIGLMIYGVMLLFISMFMVLLRIKNKLERLKDG